MQVTVTGKLNRAANEFQAGESIGFGLRLGDQYYDRETKQKEWTNYECVVFAKASGQIDLYRKVLIEGAIIEIKGDNQKIKVFDGNKGPIHSIEVIGARLGYFNAPAPDYPPSVPDSSANNGDGFEDLDIPL